MSLLKERAPSSKGRASRPLQVRPLDIVGDRGMRIDMKCIRGTAILMYNYYNKRHPHLYTYLENPHTHDVVDLIMNTAGLYTTRGREGHEHDDSEEKEKM